MSIREVVQTENLGTTKRCQRLVRVLVVENQDLYATWQVVLRNGKHREVTTQVSPDLIAKITDRPAFQTIMQQIADDTLPRTGA